MRKSAFLEVFTDATGGNPKLKTSGYFLEGAFPVIDQGKAEIAGYSNDASLLAIVETPVIIFGDHTRIIKYVDHPFILGADGTKVLRPNNGTDPRYLFHYLRSLRIPSAGYSRHYKFLKEVSIPLPSLESQRRIAGILDKADELRTKRRQALASLDALTRSIFRDMFDSSGNKDMATIPVATFGEVLNFRTGKLDSNAAEPNGKYPFFTCAKDISYINEFAFDQEALLLAGNNASGTYDVKRYRGKFNAYQRTYVIDIDRERLAFAYVHAVLEDRLEQMRRSSRGSGTKYLTLSILRPMSIPIPPLQIQDEFERRVSATERLKDQHRAQLAQLDALFASLQRRAFEGEL